MKKNQKKIVAKKKNGISNVEKVAMGAGAAAMSAASAGAYYLFGPKAKMHQKKAKILMEKMKKEVMSEVKKVKKVTPPIYHKAVDIVSKNYAKQYKLHEEDVKAFAEKLKNEWKDVSKLAKNTVKTLKKKNV